MKQDNKAELLPLVDEQGRVVGQATRGRCHDGVSMLLHPVVHLHVFNPRGEVYLQHRPAWKDVQPGKWDTAVGGHIDAGETVDEALMREVREEIGLTSFTPEFVGMYTHQSDCERELVHIFRTTVTEVPEPSDELDGGRFFSLQEMDERMGTDFFTPNFESEWKRYAALLCREFPLDGDAR